MSALDRILVAAAAELERRTIPCGPLSVEQACEVLGELGRGLAAVVDVLDGRPNEYVPGSALTWFAQGPADGSLLSGLVRALAGAEESATGRQSYRGKASEPT